MDARRPTDDMRRPAASTTSPSRRDWRDEVEAPKAKAPPEDPFPLIWHGDEDDTPLTEWLVDETLFKVGTALISGQWGTYKTFAGFDLSAAVMVGGTFAGRKVKRAGGVLWIAVEGQTEVRKRLAAVAAEKIKPAIDGEAITLDPDHLPFAWVKACPTLSDPDALVKMKALVGKAAAGMKERFGLDLALVIIDTLSPAAALKDANDTGSNQHVMTVLKQTALAFDTLVCAVDHMGKDTSTGTRNSSVKEADVDSVIALLGERDLAGNVANPRLAMRKNRAAPTGWEIKFDKRVVTVASGFDVTTTLVIDWATGTEIENAKVSKAEKPAWRTAAERTLKGCLERALIDHGIEQQPYGRLGGKVKAVPLSKVRDAFESEYPSDEDDPKKAKDAKRSAFKRAREGAMTKGLVQTKQIGASLVDWIWLVSESPLTQTLQIGEAD